MHRSSTCFTFIFPFSVSVTDDNADQGTKDDTSPKDTEPNSEAKAKKIKNLKKKIRQIDELQAKVKSGELKELTIEQKGKLARKEALLKELEEVEGI